MNGWISVEDGLPEEKQFVLVYGKNLYPNKHDAGCMAVSWHIDYNYWFGFGRTGKITHWMPLPEPPREQKKRIKDHVCNNDYCELE